MIRHIFFCILTVVITGCAATGDPNQGGLFGWSEEKAIDRQKNLQGMLQEEQQRGEVEKQTSGILEGEKNAKSAEFEQHKAMLNAIDADLENISKKIKKSQTDTAIKQKEKQRIQKEVERLKKERNNLKNDPNLLLKKERRDALDKEVDALLKMAESL